MAGYSVQKKCKTRTINLSGNKYNFFLLQSHIFYRPVVAGAVLKTPLWFTYSVIPWWSSWKGNLSSLNCVCLHRLLFIISSAAQLWIYKSVCCSTLNFKNHFPDAVCIFSNYICNFSNTTWKTFIYHIHLLIYHMRAARYSPRKLGQSPPTIICQNFTLNTT